MNHEPGDPHVTVLHATPSYAPAYRFGGPIHSLEGLVEGLRGQGADVRVVTTDVAGPDGSRLEVPSAWTSFRGVPVLYLPAVWFDATPRTFDTVLREARRADVVHVTGVFNVPSMLALAAALAASRPVVLSPRGALEGAALRSKRASAKRAWLAAHGPLLRRVRAFHATSEQEARSIRARFPVAEIVVVPNGTTVQPSLPRTFACRVGAIGRIHPIKGYDLLIRAVARLAARGLGVELVIGGPVEDEAHHRALQTLARELSVQSRVRFVGELRGREKAELLATLGVLALPSHSENFGNVVVEALAAGIPVVASRATPWAELESERCGRWVENAPDSLAEALGEYLVDPVRARDAGDRGRALVERRYSWDAVARDMLGLYRLVTGPRR
jgi:glycosyltransferase involved in cell wall biosynthesis